MTGRAYARARRWTDVVCAGTLAVLLLPVILVVLTLIRWRMGSPVLFRQLRPGIDQKPFQLLKFRTMVDANGPTGELLPDAQRLTPLGRSLRRWSLDELPTLLNVIRGDMSLVGPRPLLMRYLPYYTDRERARFSVPPGLTGWAQVNGRNNAPWSERLERDVWYVENRNPWLDFKILLRTPLNVFRGQDVVVDARSIMRNLDEERSRADVEVAGDHDGR